MDARQPYIRLHIETVANVVSQSITKSVEPVPDYCLFAIKLWAPSPYMEDAMTFRTSITKAVACLVGALLSCVPLRAQTERRIEVDVAKVAGPHSRVPLMMVGAGRANEGLRADWQQQLATVQREIGFRYLRFHGLLSDDMGVYTEDAQGRPMYNFQYIDVLYDALFAQHIRPFVELSFMPAKLASGDKTVFWWKGNITPPKDMAKWNGLIRALLDHWVERYGRDEVAQWYFEVWNEPDLTIFWSGTQAQYFELYRNTAETIKAVCAACRVGGPASAYYRWEQPWLNFVAANHVPADFLSTHTYAVKTGAVDVDGTALTLTDTRPEAITWRVAQSRRWITESATPQLQLHYTEWSTSYTPTDFIHDQYISAPFILQKLRETAPLADSMSYWTFTDIFEENGPRFTPFHGGFGLLNYQGIRKPAFFAYKFLAQLGPEDLSTDDKQNWITRKPDGSVQALVWNYTPVETPPNSNNQHFYREERPTRPAPSARLVIRGLRPGRYTLRVVRVGYHSNDAYTAYLHMGAPQQLTRAQVAALQQAANGAPELIRLVQVKGKGDFDLPLSIRENDVVFATLSR